LPKGELQSLLPFFALLGSTLFLIACVWQNSTLFMMACVWQNSTLCFMEKKLRFTEMELRLPRDETLLFIDGISCKNAQIWGKMMEFRCLLS
jgi:hypothetical protein